MKKLLVLALFCISTVIAEEPAIFVDSNKNVGIGKSSGISAKLEIESSVPSTAILVERKGVDSSDISTIRLRGIPQSNNSTDRLGINFEFQNSAQTVGGYSALIVSGKESDWTTGDKIDGYLGFFTSKNGGGEEHLRINSEGNVGIGELSPSSKLDVAGWIEMNGLKSNRSDGDLYLQTGDATNIMQVDQSDNHSILFFKNVGIGKSSGISAKLEIESSVSSTAILVERKGVDSSDISTIRLRGIPQSNNSTDRLGINFEFQNSAQTVGGYSALIVSGKESDWTTGDKIDGYLGFFTSKNGGGEEHLRINSEGNVGIGELSPSSKLDVAGWIEMNGLKSNRSDGDLYLQTGDATNIMQVDQSDNHSILFFKNVGIGAGVSSPSSKLTLKTGINGDGYELENGSGTTVSRLMLTNSDAGALNLYDGGSQKISINGHAGANSFIDNGGNFGVNTNQPSKNLYVNGSAGGTQSWNASDERYKENIDTITNALDKVKQMRGVSYRWIQGKTMPNGEEHNVDDALHLGVIAQEVESVIPELVDNPGETEEMKHVDFNAFSGLFIEAIKEQDVRVENLEKENLLLKQEIDSLKVLVNSKFKKADDKGN